MILYTFDVWTYRNGIEIRGVLTIEADTEELAKMAAANLLAYPAKMELR